MAELYHWATELAGVTVPVISPEDLVMTKIRVGWPKDPDDIDRICARTCPHSAWIVIEGSSRC